MGTFLGASIIRTLVFGGLCWGPLVLGTYNIGRYRCVPGYLGMSWDMRPAVKAVKVSGFRIRVITLNSSFHFLFHYPYITPI